MIIDTRLFEDVCIKDIAVISGIRPSGRIVDHKYGRHNHGLLYIWCGDVVFRTVDSAFTAATGGDLLFIPKHKKYTMEYLAPQTTFVLVNFNMTGNDGEDAYLSHNITVLAKDDERNRIARIMTGFELCSTPGIPSLLRRKELIYRLLCTVYASAIKEKSEPQKSSKIFEGVLLLEQTYMENLPISRFAEACHVSENSFRALFNKQFKTSPVQYRNRLRIERARTLLSEGGFTVAEVAYASGFDNVGYFCKMYKRWTGETPSQTKKASDE